MAVQLNNPTTKLENILPIDGINIAITSAGIRKRNREDLCLFLLEDDAAVAGVFTQNKCCAAPVTISQQHLVSKNNIKALLINSGCANAATGKEGFDDAVQTCEVLAELINCQPSQILPFSTGVILERLPMDKMISGIKKSYSNKSINSANSDEWLQAARAIMTTDTITKIYSANDDQYKVTGIAKGAGMIHPNMATMLGFMATDAKFTSTLLSQLTQEIADETFNAITIDGDTSTNDSFVIIATNKIGDLINSTAHPQYNKAKQLLLQVAKNLAQSIVRDGEGATKFVAINVVNAKDKKDACQVAEKIALSPLVKTAFFASDPNLGRILSAIGNSDINSLDMNKVDLLISNKNEEVLVAQNGGRAKSYDGEGEKTAFRIMQGSDFNLEVNLNCGQATYTKYTCDLGYDYIKINAEYRT